MMLPAMQSGSVAADVTVTGTISVADASSVLGTTYDILDDAATVAGAITAGNAEVNGANSITTNGGAVDLSFTDADSLLNGNGTAPAQTGSVAADVTVTDDISVAQASSVLGATYDVVDDAATVASALTAGDAEVNGAASITTNGGAVSLSFADADSLLNGNDVAPMQSGSVAADVTVTGTISVAEASSVLGTTYHILDDADIIAEALVAQGYRDGMDQFVISREDEAEILGGPLFPQLPDGMSEEGIREQILLALEEMDGGLPNGPMVPPLPDGMPLPGDDMDWSESMTMGDGSEESGSPDATGTGIPEINSAASVTTNGGPVNLTFEQADALLNGNGTAPMQTGSVAADVTVTDDISVAQASDVLGTTYDILDDAATVASALTAGNAEVNGAASITTNGGAVDLSFADADSLLNGNGTAPAQTGSVAADVTVTGTISVADASSVLGTTYDVLTTRRLLLLQ